MDISIDRRSATTIQYDMEFIRISSALVMRFSLGRYRWWKWLNPQYCCCMLFIMAKTMNERTRKIATFIVHIFKQLYIVHPIQFNHPFHVFGGIIYFLAPNRLLWIFIFIFYVSYGIMDWITMDKCFTHKNHFFFAHKFSHNKKIYFAKSFSFGFVSRPKCEVKCVLYGFLRELYGMHALKYDSNFVARFYHGKLGRLFHLALSSHNLLLFSRSISCAIKLVIKLTWNHTDFILNAKLTFPPCKHVLSHEMLYIWILILM